MIAYWANFATTGNPNGTGLPLWPAYDAKTDMSMELGDNIGARPIPNKAQLDFLKNFLDKEAR